MKYMPDNNKVFNTKIIKSYLYEKHQFLKPKTENINQYNIFDIECILFLADGAGLKMRVILFLV